MDLSVIIVNYRGWKRLKECLDSLVAFTGDLFHMEVIIVDNNSEDGTIDKFKSDYPGFVFIVNKVNGGFSNGCNLGSTIAAGDFLLFLNPDTVVSETAVKKLLVRAEKYHAYSICSCRQENEKGIESRAYGLFPGFGTLTGPGRAIYRILRNKKIEGKTKENNDLITPDWISGSVMMIKKEFFSAIGGFDEDFWMYFEDVDICRRAKDQNGRIAFFTDITIQHNHGGSSRTDFKTTSMTKTEVFISNHLYISKHKKGLSKILLQSCLVFYNLISGFFGALAGLLFFASQKMFSGTIIFGRLVDYYLGAILRGSWISPRSVNYKYKNV